MECGVGGGLLLQAVAGLGDRGVADAELGSDFPEFGTAVPMAAVNGEISRLGPLPELAFDNFQNFSDGWLLVQGSRCGKIARVTSLAQVSVGYLFDKPWTPQYSRGDCCL